MFVNVVKIINSVITFVNLDKKMEFYVIQLIILKISNGNIKKKHLF